MQQDRYSLPQRWLHWIIAALVLPALAAGALFFALGFGGLKDTFGMETTNALYKYHKTAGVLVLALMLLRLVLRIRLGAPPKLESLTPQERILSTGVQHLLYLALFAVPTLGWAATAAGGYPVEFFSWKLPGLIAKNPPLAEVLFALHGLAALAVLGLLALHIAGALRHWLIKKDGVMRRMSLFG
ncbi:cytochrome b/b6 domain-containing protein [Nisaea acidiphila]|uniref:Cytochrome b/b6 domain-containing protein n=1 Tax=Nisaea acidiphila TaxID=1862145 RepID=A0A9J7AMY3_9PROT|nr:cytochrome b/b6 domain-containing protein [Nisaea acidiphila]UUX48535.1 cytochrome b/b6 domain-containing protein [Nisaea acidiphila]